MGRYGELFWVFRSEIMPKKKLIEIIKELLKADLDMIFLHQLDEEELKALADSIKERIDGLKDRLKSHHQ
jgi:hypothetical protein